ncbi:MAG: FeoC-like transcriptional regulator [Corynebacterium sp.]|nr:FeoC-like transcriptional regulator [Corynebacterium sp.]
MFFRKTRTPEHPERSSRPMAAVLEAIEAGANTKDAIVKRTALSEGTVSIVLEHLARMGKLDSHVESVCAGACGSCASDCDHRGDAESNPAFNPPAAALGRGLHVLTLKPVVQ